MDLKNRLLFIFRNSGYYVVMAFIFLLCWLPQIFYWKTLTGKIFFYSYTKEGFDFLHPHLKNGLFGFANGWLAYTPVMIFAVIGLIFLPKYFKKNGSSHLSIYACFCLCDLQLVVLAIYKRLWFAANGGNLPDLGISLSLFFTFYLE
jgi:hypothetical protein